MEIQASAIVGQFIQALTAKNLEGKLQVQNFRGF